MAEHLEQWISALNQARLDYLARLEFEGGGRPLTPEKVLEAMIAPVLVPVPPEARADYFIKTSVVTAPELSQAHLDDFDCVILARDRRRGPAPACR